MGHPDEAERARRHERRRRRAGLVIAALIVAFSLSPQYRSYRSLPGELRVPLAEGQRLEFRLPLVARVRADRPGVIALNGRGLDGSWAVVNLRSPLVFEPLGAGRVILDFRLFGLLPLRRIAVDVIPPVAVMPGGQAVGIMVRSEGVLVVGYSGVRGDDGALRQPARDAGIDRGDVVVRVDGEPVNSEEEMTYLVERAGREGRPARLELRRGGAVLTRNVAPVWDRDARRHRIGLYVRDATAGVGTLTFYDAERKIFAALGHVVTDSDTRTAVPIADGRLLRAVVTGIEQGRRGEPGEKISTFADGSEVLGRIERNTEFGIIGLLDRIPEQPLYDRPLPVAMHGQVRTGPAEILTVVEGQQVERFAVEITRVLSQRRPEGKGIVLRITDRRLLARSGGIVQGMSGSPIIQDGRLVGAVTHVFVNDPARGYGVFAEWMVMEAGLLGRRAAGAGLLEVCAVAV